MAVKPGKKVEVVAKRGTYAMRSKQFIRNARGVKLKGIVRRAGA